MRHFLAPALVVLAACGLRAPAHAPGRALTPRPAAMTELRAAIERRIAAVPGAEGAVWLQDLASGDTLALNATTSFHAASTMKVPVMIELFRRLDAGQLRLDSTLVIRNEFKSIVDGSPFSLDPGDEPDSSLFRRLGQRVTLRELNELMITLSSNFATNILIDQLDARAVNATAHALGATTMQVRRGVEDTKAFNAGLNNTTTARDLGVLMAAISQDRAASRASSHEMREVLNRQESRGEIPAGLPAGTRVEHKTGWITATRHDAAIIYPPGRAPYVLVVLTRAIPKETVAQQLIADISRDVWGAVTRP